MNINKIKVFAIKNIVPIMFLGVSVIGIIYARVPLPIIFNDVIARMARNCFLVLSLLIPVLAGMGLNFGIVIGAMAGQIGLFIISVFKITGITGLIVATLIALPLAVLFGWLTAKLLNKTKGQEMITSLILGFFAMGVYQFVFLFAIGGIIKFEAPGILLSSGVGVRNTVNLDAVRLALDNVLKVDIFTFLIGLAIAIFVWATIKCIKLKSWQKVSKITYIGVVLLVIGIAGLVLPALIMYKTFLRIPVVIAGLIVLLCLFIGFFFKTKLGQDMRAVGQNMEIAEVSGIHVDKVRTIAVILSMVFAAVGQIIFLQNLGNFSTYNAHENVAMFASAALLIGGASINKATVSQAILGTFLFHLLFNVSPIAGKNIFGTPEIGEYFRVFVAYGIIAITLALHAWNKANAAAAKNKVLMNIADKKQE